MAEARAPTYHGTQAALFDYAAENMSMARVQADLAVTYAGVGDAVGLEYATRRLIAYIKAAIPTVRELRAADTADRQRSASP